MLYKKLELLLLHRLIPGRWRSPYQRIAYELMGPARQSSIHRLLDCGFNERASLILEDSNLATPALLARSAYARGDIQSARQHLNVALRQATTTRLDEKYSIKLLARLFPSDAGDWAQHRGETRLAAQIYAAMQPKKASSLLAQYERNGDEHLLVANSCDRPSEKLAHLNQYFNEMGLKPIRLADESGPFDINNLLPEEKELLSGTSNQDLPEISVVMTVHNGANYIRSAALSVLNQRDVVADLIIVDDASTDATAYEISRLIAENPRCVRTLSLPTNVGTYRAKNIALPLCDKKYVAFQDSDDWSHPQRLATAVSWLEKSPQHVAATCRYVRLGTDANFYSPANWPLRQWSPNTLIFKRETVLSKIGGFDPVKTGGDTDYFERLRAVFGDKQLVYHQQPLLIAMGLPSSLMHNTLTGIDTRGYSAQRLAYREMCAERILASIKNKGSLTLPINTENDS